MISIWRHFPIERPVISTIPFVLVLLAITVYTVPYIGLSYAQTTFPPPIFLKLRDIPSYAITIPFSSSGNSPFEPSEISIPVGMTVIWFNDDNGEHSVTTEQNSTSPSPEILDSGPIQSMGGSFVHTFTKQGVYNYYDQNNPSVKGYIHVGGPIEEGKYLNMITGGKLPFDPKEPNRILLSFVPKAIQFPSTTSITYNVIITNSTGKPIFTHMYIDDDGILDLELIPRHAANATRGFTTWGPDFIGEEGYRTTGTFHIMGPVLITAKPYSISISIVGVDNTLLTNPPVDTFDLPLEPSVT
jgi:plastocyanin